MATISPALGSQACIASSSTYQFLAIADDSGSGSKGTLEVWTDLSGSWREHAFEEHNTSFGNLLVAQVPLSGEGSYQFTYRIRESSGNVIWLSQAAGDDNGTIVIKPSTSTADYDPVAKADETLEVVEEEREGDITTKTIAFALGAGHEGKVESFRMISLGGWSSGRAIERSKPTWFTARHLTPYSGLSPVSDCQLLLYHSGNQVVACFPLSLPDCWSVLRGCSEGSDTVWLRSERETARSAAAQCVVSWGPEHKLLEVIDSCTAQAKKIIDASAVQENATESDRRAQSRWSLRDTVKPVYCTWNSLGQKYTYSGLVRRLEALRASGDLPYFESLLLDDGWQDVAYSPENQNLRGLRSFGLRNGWLDEDIKPLENESKLAAVVRTLKSRFPEIKTIGVWMTLQGYWNGLHPDSEISKTYKLSRYGVRDSQAQYPYPEPFEYIYLPSPEDTNRYWTDYLTTLKKAGIDYVKIDNEAALDYLTGTGVAEMRAHVSKTARAVALQVFGSGNLINCMAGSPRCYNAFLAECSDPSASLRTSDDFYPNEPDSHRYHIADNATTALLDRKLRVTRDFDMFITHHDLAEYHAMLRCFSTAPLYITDSEPSNKQIWKRLGGLDPQGNYRIVKATTNSSVRLPSTAFTDVTGQGNGPALKVALAVPSANGAVVGLWNCRGQGGIAVDALTHEELAEALKLDKHDRMLRERYVVMYDGNTAQVQDYEVSESSRFVLPINLATGKSVAVTVSQIQSFTSFDLAVLGLADKFVGLCSVLNVEEVKARPTQALPTEEDREESAPAQDKASEDNGQAGQKQAEDTDAIETTPLLPHPRARSPSLRSGSRLLALLLFYRRDLSAARSSLLRDFFRAPFKTLFNEIRAIFSGPSILPEGTNEDVQDVTSAQQETQEPLQATSQSYGTLINSPDTAVQHEGDVSVASDSSNATAVDKDEPSVNQIVVTLSVAGQLVLWLPGFSHEAFSITLQGNGVADKLISVSGDCVIVDMEQAAQEIGFKGTSDEAWKVGIMKR